MRSDPVLLLLAVALCGPAAADDWRNMTREERRARYQAAQGRLQELRSLPRDQALDPAEVRELVQAVVGGVSWGIRRETRDSRDPGELFIRELARDGFGEIRQSVGGFSADVTVEHLLAFEGAVRSVGENARGFLDARNARPSLPVHDQLDRLQQRDQDILNLLRGAGPLGQEYGPVFQRMTSGLRDRMRDILEPRPGVRRRPDPLASAVLAADGGYAAEAGDHAAAEAAFTDLLGMDPSNAAALSGRASARLAMGRFQEAYEDASRALKADPSDRSALAVMKFSEGRVGLAAAAAKPSRSLGDARAAAAATADEAARADAVARETEGAAGGGAAARLAADRARASVETAMKLGDMDGALAAVERGLAGSPGDPGLRGLRASLRLRKGDFAGAAEDAEEGLKDAPMDANLLRLRAFAELRAEDLDEAAAAAEGLLRLDPKDAFAYAVRAHVRGSRGDRTGLLEDLGRAAALDPAWKGTAEKALALQLPSESDVLFLFPGENGPAPEAPAAPARRGPRPLVLGAALGAGLLLAGLALRRRAPPSLRG